MLRRMFIGEPEGNYDRILDFSEALTGCNFFAPPRVFLDHCADYAHPHLRGEGGQEPNQPAINLPQGKAVFPDRADVPTSHNAEDVEAAKARFEGALRREQ